jgi:S-disulfanyl-L-cysteine oxidoreductase SoxD
MIRVVSARPVAIRGAVVTVVCAIAAALALTAYAGQARTVTQSVYSAAQARRGQTAFTAQCVLCHGPELKGAVGPMLTGDGFLAAWGGRPLSDLVDKIEKTMPPQAPGSVPRSQATDIAAYILEFGKFPAGQNELSAATLPGILFPGTLRPAATGGLSLSPTANLAQLMRGITFYNANVLFNVQVKDPGGPKPGPPVPFDYIQWGLSNYYGWQAVDQAALALIETPPLFLVPGRRCENGQPVPVERADFKQYTAELIAFGREAYRVSQTRNVDALIELTDKLTETCANCHRVYRDAATEGAIRADKCSPLAVQPAR